MAIYYRKPAADRKELPIYDNFAVRKKVDYLYVPQEFGGDFCLVITGAGREDEYRIRPGDIAIIQEKGLIAPERPSVFANSRKALYATAWRDEDGKLNYIPIHPINATIIKPADSYIGAVVAILRKM